MLLSPPVSSVFIKTPLAEVALGGSIFDCHKPYGGSILHYHNHRSSISMKKYIPIPLSIHMDIKIIIFLL